MRLGYFREVFGPDDGRVEIDRGNRYAALQEALRRVLVMTEWDERLPDSLRTRQYRMVVAHAAGTEVSSVAGFDKDALRDIADHLGAVHHDRATTRELRRAIAERAGFEYESPDSYIRTYTKDELKALTASAIREEHR